MQIKANRLFTPIRVIWQGTTNLMPGEVLWCDGNRKSSLGGYIGTFRRTYTHTGNMISPKGEAYQTPMYNVEPVKE